MANRIPVGRLRVPGAAFLLSQVGHRSTRRWEERLARLGLDPRHAVLLRHIMAAEGRTQREMSLSMGIPTSRMVALVDQLTRAKLVERRPKERDRRAHLLYLTPRGREALTRIMAVSAEHEAELCRGLTPRERRSLIALLDRMAAYQGLVSGVHPGVNEPAPRSTTKRANPAPRRG